MTSFFLQISAAARHFQAGDSLGALCLLHQLRDQYAPAQLSCHMAARVANLPIDWANGSNNSASVNDIGRQAYWAYCERLSGLLQLRLRRSCEAKLALRRADSLLDNLTSLGYGYWRPQLSLLTLLANAPSTCDSSQTYWAPYNAAIAAGGQSSRFGSNKAAAKLGQCSLVERVANSLQQSAVRVVVAPDLQRRQLEPLANWTGWQTVSESEHWRGSGPLAALLAALEAVPYGWLAFAGVDQPLLDSGYWDSLFATLSLGDNDSAAGTRQHPPQRVPKHAIASVQAQYKQRVQPLGALYHSQLLPYLRQQLAAGERRLSSAVTAECTLKLANLPARYFANVNTPEDLRQLEQEGFG